MSSLVSGLLQETGRFNCISGIWGEVGSVDGFVIPSRMVGKLQGSVSSETLITIGVERKMEPTEILNVENPEVLAFHHHRAETDEMAALQLEARWR